MDTQLSDLQNENATFRRRRAQDMEEIACLETRAMVAEQALGSSQNKMAKAQEELDLTREQKDR
jgi:hypothetical protein